MIITETVSSPVITNIASAPTRFKIKASAKAFKILSGFYSEPILAIPRELGANAWDSHVKAGNTKTPFLVHAPSQLEPWFSVRDFGTGLSVEHIDQIYTTYFESTKTGDNDSDGCMGLGSKTPFNYTDNFNVTSWFNGQKHVFNCFIDESGSPSIMHVISEDSTEHTGLEVKFGVKISDIGMWVDKITRAYAPFRNRPQIVGANITFQPRTYLYEGTGWGYRASDQWNSLRGSNAFMGNYCYPINVSALRNTLRVNDNGYRLENALSYGHFDFFFEIGELEVAPNKEQLQYEDDNATSLQIVARIQKAVDELKVIALKNLEVPKTRWEGMALFAKYNSHGNEFYRLRDIIGDIPVVFNGAKIISSHETVHTTHTNAGVTADATGNRGRFDAYCIDSLYGKIKKIGNYSNTGSAKTIFFYTNGTTIKKARLRHYLLTNYGQGQFPRCYVIADDSAGAKNFHAHCAYFGWDSALVVEIEKLPKPPVAARIKKTATTNEIFYASLSSCVRARYNGTVDANMYWNKKGETIDSSKTYYYVNFLYSDVANDTQQLDRVFVNSMFKLIAEKAMTNGEDIIYGINKKNRHLLKVGNWVNVLKLCENYIAKHKAEFERELYLMSFSEKISNFGSLARIIKNNRGFLSNLENVDTKNLFTKFSATYTKFVEEDIRTTRTECFYTNNGITAKSNSADPIDLTALNTLLQDKYMSVFSLLEDYGTEKGAQLAKLVNFIDKNS